MAAEAALHLFFFFCLLEKCLFHNGDFLFKLFL
jgi:hypothetical protein